MSMKCCISWHFISFDTICKIIEPWHEISNNVVCATSKGSNQSARIEYFMSVKLLTEHHLEFLSLKESCTGSSESTLIKMPHCWKSSVTAHMNNLQRLKYNVLFRKFARQPFKIQNGQCKNI